MDGARFWATRTQLVADVMALQGLLPFLRQPTCPGNKDTTILIFFSNALTENEMNCCFLYLLCMTHGHIDSLRFCIDRDASAVLVARYVQQCIRRRSTL